MNLRESRFLFAHHRARRPSSLEFLLFFLLFVFTAPPPALAGVVSRLGDIYFYDAMLFDASVLQRGVRTLGRLNARGLSISSALDLPFYQEFSLRMEGIRNIGFSPQDFTNDVYALRWRIRMPILELARYARLRSIQINYAGGYGWPKRSDFAPLHELNGAWSFSKRQSGMAVTEHFQIGMALRSPLEPDTPLFLGRLGAIVRAAWIVQLFDPSAGFSGAWTLTLSAIEIDAAHYGLSSQGGEGFMDVALAAPALHFTPLRATYSLGLLPTTTWIFGPERSEHYWSILVRLSVFYRNEFD